MGQRGFRVNTIVVLRLAANVLKRGRKRKIHAIAWIFLEPVIFTNFIKTCEVTDNQTLNFEF